jgi:hypothetical protein
MLLSEICGLSEVYKIETALIYSEDSWELYQNYLMNGVSAQYL